MLEIIKSPWKDKFLDCIRSTEEEIKICSPFVKTNILKEVYANKSDNVNCELVTNINFVNFVRKSSDIEAIEFMLDKNNIVKNFQNLHAKIYIFDNSSVVVTSANLTNFGLTRNYEYGIYCDENDFVKKVCDDYNSIVMSDLCGTVTIDNIIGLKNILDKIPKEKRYNIPKEITDNLSDEEIQPDEIYNGDIEPIVSSLSGWKLAIFKQLNKIDKIIFELNDVYSFVNELHELYPDNQHIEDKIRQQLQYLRDLGLIRFLGNGRYKKLWV